MSHIAYVAAYHNWLQSERNKINAIIRRAYKAALGLFEGTSTTKLLSLGVHNTLEEIAEAQRTSQLERLSTTEAGRKILRDLGYEAAAGNASSRVPIPDETRCRIMVDPLPRNVNPQYNRGRRAARAKALIDVHASDGHARYVDAAEYQGDREAFAVVVRGATRAAASVPIKEASEAEEVAIALAIADAGCQTVLSDSKNAVRNFARGRVCKEVERVLRTARLQKENRSIRLKWFPAHAGEDASATNDNHNETAHATARALTNRAATTDRPEWCGVKDRMTDYNEVTKFHRLARRTLPPPHPGLSRAEAVLLRQLQTGSLPTPVLMKHIYPEAYPTDTCQVCQRGRADFVDVLWDCVKFPERASTRRGRLPSRLEAAMASYDQEE
ncbi:uncharacterized protein LOC144156182 [Haemaphysalis longicornis]